MLPDFLFSSYKQYKSDTDSIASWLATTAKKCGYPPDLLLNISHSQRAGRLKGKNRKAAQAKAASTASNGNNPLSSKPKYLIAIKDFILLAQCIAGDAKIPIEGGAEFFATLGRAIAARKDHRAWVSASLGPNDSNDIEAPDGHQFFIGVLEEVHNILRPKMSQASIDAMSQLDASYGPSTLPSDDKAFTNMFEGLGIEQPSEAFLSSTPVNLQAKPDIVSDVNYEAEAVHDFAETYLAIYCFLMDLNKLRSFIRQSWAMYNVGALDLLAASIATNSALDLAQRLEEDFLERFPEKSEPQEIIKIFFVAQCVLNGEDPDHRERQDDPINFKMYNIADVALLPTYVILDSFTDLIEPGYLPSYKPGFFGHYDPSSDRNHMSGRERFQEDKIILLEILTDFLIIVTGTKNIPAEDEITRSFRPYILHKRINFATLMGAQAFLDAHRVLRQGIASGYDDLVRAARYIESSIQQNLLFHKDLRVSNWPRANDRVLEGILTQIKDWVKNDPIATARLKMGDVVEPIQHNLLKQHPLLCGTLTFNLKAHFQEYGIAFANAWGSLKYTGQLYNAVRQEKYLAHVWPDMEMAINMHGENSFFIGAPPKTIDDFFKHFCISMGYSAVNFAKNRRKTKTPVAAKEGPRGLSELSLVSQMFKERLCENSIRGPRYDLSADDVEKILRRAGIGNALHKAVEAEETIDSTAPIQTGDDKVLDQKLHKQWSLRQHWEQSHSCTPLQLLQALRSAIQDEVVELTFDHFRLHRMCWILLRQVKERLDPEFKRIYEPGYLETESQLPFAVGYIFLAATSEKKAGDLLKAKKANVVTKELLQRSGDLLDSMIQSGAGQLVIKLMKDFAGVEIELEDE